MYAILCYIDIIMSVQTENTCPVALAYLFANNLQSIEIIFFRFVISTKY